METKTQFFKRRAAEGSFLNTLVNKLPFEIHLPGHYFTGAGTKLYKLLNPDGTPTKLIITIYVIQNTMILQLGMRFVIRQYLMSGIVNPTLRQGIDKSIVGKLINAKS